MECDDADVPQHKGHHGWYIALHLFTCEGGETVRCTAAEAQVMEDAERALEYAREDKAAATSLPQRLVAELAEQEALAEMAYWWETLGQGRLSEEDDTED